MNWTKSLLLAGLAALTNTASAEPIPASMQMLSKGGQEVVCVHQLQTAARVGFRRLESSADPRKQLDYTLGMAARMLLFAREAERLQVPDEELRRVVQWSKDVPMLTYALHAQYCLEEGLQRWERLDRPGREKVAREAFDILQTWTPER